MIASSFCQCNINSTGRNELKKKRRALLFWLQDAAFSHGELIFYHIAEYIIKNQKLISNFICLTMPKYHNKNKFKQVLIGERILEISRF